jgi:hypothetical protein
VGSNPTPSANFLPLRPFLPLDLSAHFSNNPIVTRVILLLCAALSAPAAEVSFSKDIAPVLAKKCLTCHNPEKKKGGYDLQNFEALLKPGKGGSAPLEPGAPEKSELFRRLTTSDADDRMPQKDDPLSADTIALFKNWIGQGARFDGKDKTLPLSALIPSANYPAPPLSYPHPVAILSLVFNTNGSQLLVGGYHEILVCSTATAEVIERMTNLARRVHSLAWSSNQAELWAASGTPGLGGEVAILPAGSRAPTERLARIADEQLALTFSPDGTLVAVGGADNAIHLFDAKTRQEKLTINQHADWVTSLCFSPDGKHLASASRDRTARVYSTTTGDLETTYTGHSAALHAVTFNPDGKEVWSAGRDKAIHVWKSDDGKELRKLSDFSGDIYFLLHHNGFIYAACADGQVREYSAPERKLTRSFAAHGDAVFALAVNPSTKTLASAGYEGQIKLWDLATGKETKSFVPFPQIR